MELFWLPVSVLHQSGAVFAEAPAIKNVGEDVGWKIIKIVAMSTTKIHTFGWLSQSTIILTFLKNANWRSSTEVCASSKSTVFDNRALAWAVDKRIIVSKLRAVTGCVWKQIKMQIYVFIDFFFSSGNIT